MSLVLLLDILLVFYEDRDSSALRTTADMYIVNSAGEWRALGGAPTIVVDPMDLPSAIILKVLGLRNASIQCASFGCSWGS